MTDLPFLAMMAGIGLAGAFLSGLLGIGGAVFIIPMLLYVPPAVHAGQFTMPQATGLSIILVLFGSLGSAYAHRRQAAACPRCVRLLGPAVAAAALLGAVLSRWTPSGVLTLVFAALALTAAIVMFLPHPPGGDEPTDRPADFPPLLGIAIAAAVGLAAGLVGAGGAFILVPLMIFVLRIPTRVVVAVSPGIVFLSALAGATGKVATGQVLWLPAAALLLGSLPGAQIGAWVSHRLRAATLRHALGTLTALVAVKMWVDLLH